MKNELKTKVFEFGTYNHWRGFVGLYFTKKELRLMAAFCNQPVSAIESMKLRELYKLL